jgi:hypothetical protein
VAHLAEILDAGRRRAIDRASCAWWAREDAQPLAAIGVYEAEVSALIEAKHDTAYRPVVVERACVRGTKRPSRHAPLGGHLDACRSAVVTVGFDDIEGLPAVRLPAPARRRRAWWANDAAHNQ